MADLFHQWGSDLALGPTGDLALVSDQLLGQQRVLRRLLTNPGDYIWQLDYGAGLGRFVGAPASPLHVRAVVRGQIFKETAVAPFPEPVIDVVPMPAGDSTTLYINVRYSDSRSGQVASVGFSVE